MPPATPAALPACRVLWLEHITTYDLHSFIPVSVTRGMVLAITVTVVEIHTYSTPVKYPICQALEILYKIITW